MMRNSRHIIVAVLSLAAMLVSCNHEKPESVPMEGVVSYDVYYSGSIRDHGIVGKMLPSKITGAYNKDGVTMGASAGLGMVKMNMVASKDDSFMTIEVGGDKLLVPFEDLFTEADYIRKDTSIVSTEQSVMEEVAGWQSKRVSTVVKSPWGELKVETYYVPMEGYDNVLKCSPVEKIPGLITALKINTGESGVIVMLGDIESKQVDSKKEFVRPTGCKNVNREVLDSMIVEHLGIELPD